MGRSARWHAAAALGCPLPPLPPASAAAATPPAHANVLKCSGRVRRWQWHLRAGHLHLCHTSGREAGAIGGRGRGSAGAPAQKWAAWWGGLCAVHMRLPIVALALLHSCFLPRTCRILHPCLSTTAACLHPLHPSRHRHAPLPRAPQRPRVEVVRSGVEPVVPRVGDVVTARVVRINPRLAAGGRPLPGRAPAGRSSMVHCCPVTATLRVVLLSSPGAHPGMLPGPALPPQWTSSVSAPSRCGSGTAA